MPLGRCWLYLWLQQVVDGQQGRAPVLIAKETSEFSGTAEQLLLSQGLICISYALPL